MKIPQFVVSWIILGSLSLSIGGCCTTNGLVKTPLGDRTRVDYPSLGVSLELPKQSGDLCARYTLKFSDTAVFQSNANVRAELILGMHPAWAGPLAEPRHWLVFFITRVSPQQFDDFLRGRQEILTGIFGNKPQPFRSEVFTYSASEQHNWKKYMMFRRDIRLANGDIVVAGARLVDNEGAIPNKEEDIKAITEILNSIKPEEAVREKKH